jgi:hypothetical protein
VPPGAEVLDQGLAGAHQGRQPLALRIGGNLATLRGRENGAELGDHSGIDAVVLGQPARRSGKMAHPLGIEPLLQPRALRLPERR